MVISALRETRFARWVHRVSMIWAIAAIEVAPAGSMPLTFEFAGHLNHVDAALAGHFHIGQPYRGFYRFDPAAVDRRPDTAFIAQYPYEDFSIVIGDYAGAAPTGMIDLMLNNNVQSPGLPPGFSVGFNRYDIYRVQNHRFRGPVFGDTLGAFVPMEFSLQLTDETGTALLDDRLPLVPPDPAEFDFLQQFRLSFLLNGDPMSNTFASVYGPLITLNSVIEIAGPLTPVPVPNTGALLAMAFFALALVLFGPRAVFLPRASRM